MRIDIDIPSGDYRTTTPFLHEHVEQPGPYNLKRQLVHLNNVAAVDVSVHVAASGIAPAAFTDAIRAASEVDRVAALAAAADPAPERNVIGTPIPMTVKEGESIYFFMRTGDAAVAGSAKLFIDAD